MQDFEISKEDEAYYRVRIESFPLSVEISCKHVRITAINCINTIGLKCSEFKL